MSACEHGIDVGAYVLRAMSDDESARFAGHVSGCEICRRAVAELGVVADTLPMSVPQVAPPPELKGRLMAVVESEAALLRAAGPEADRPPAAEPARDGMPWWRRMLAVRPAVAATFACALLALGVAGGVLVAGGGDDGPGTRVFPTQVAVAGAKASLAVTGSHAALRVQGMPSPPPGHL
jgi:hypothetical protein